MPDLVEAAVLLASRGYRVFPTSADKAPLTPRGHLDGSSDETAVRALPWREDGGIGLVVPERTFVVDVDPRNGGAETMQVLLGVPSFATDSLPRTRTVRTRSGGWHFYYRVPDDRELRGRLGPGVDIKKPGRGYVLVPPTVGYVYARGGAPAPAPEWLLEEATMERRVTDCAASKPKFFRGIVAGSPYGIAALRQKCAAVREHDQGGRRAHLNAAAFVLGSLVAGGELDEERTLESLLEAALDSGLSEDQALKTMHSGFNAGLANPRQAA